ncbi:MAG: carboxypeptidase regulatory-like domain-containing protein [Gemmatimonadota bacterium]
MLQLLAALAAVHGTVRGAGSGPAAGVEVQLDGTERTITDSLGHYAVSMMAPGTHRFQFSGVGFAPRAIIVLLADSSDLSLDIELTVQAVALPTIDVVAHDSVPDVGDLSAAGTAQPEGGLRRIERGWQESSPGGGVDLQQFVGTLPGVSMRSGNATALSIRGGRGSENLLLLDGVPLLGAVHFAGATSAVNPDAISGFDLHTGVSSSRFGGSLAGVTELRTDDKDPVRPQLSGTLTATDGRSLLRASLGGRGGVLLGVRSSFRNLLSDGTGFGVHNGYDDLLAAAHLRLGSGMARLVAFGNDNRLGWEAGPGDADGSGRSSPGSLGVPVDGNRAVWRSGALGASWTTPVGRTGEWRTVASWSGSSGAIRTSGAGNVAHVTSGMSEFGVRSELVRHSGAGNVLAGLEVQQPTTWYTASATTSDATQRLDLRSRPVFGAAYGEWDWQAGARLDAHVGLRATSDLTTVTVDPRLRLGLTPRAGTRFEFGFGRTHQPVQSMLNEDNLASGIIGMSLPVISVAGAPVAMADQWEFSVAQRLGLSTRLVLEGYARQWFHVLTPEATTGALFGAGTPRYDDGRSRGLIAELSGRRGRVVWHASTGWTYATQRIGTSAFHTGAEQPWSVAGDASYRASDRTAVQLRWNTGAGQLRSPMAAGLEWHAYQPATGVGELEGVPTNLPGTINSLRLAGPIRIDLGVGHFFPLGGTQSTRGLRAGLRAENLLNRAEPVGIVAQPDGSYQLLRGNGRAAILEIGWVF